MPSRLAISSLLLAAMLGGSGHAAARSQPPAKDRSAGRPSAERWVSMVVTKVSRSGQRASPNGTGGIARDTPVGTVTIRVRIGADGTLEGAAIDESSGSAALDTRALDAAKAAAPFSPPPQKLLTLEGFTELAFPVEFARAGE